MSTAFTVTVKAPSNIAFVKYWGRRDEATRWPSNDSLSMTLNAAYTETKATLTQLPTHEVYYAGQQLFETDAFAKKIFAHLKFMAKELGFSERLRIDTKNSFPSSCGFASSASGFAALTLAAVSAWTRSKSFEELEQSGFSRSRLSDLARLGSGSACRSMFGGYVHWVAGETPALQHTKAIASADTWELANIMMVVSDKKKGTSSSQGQQVAASSPFFAPRVAIVPERIIRVSAALKDKDMDALGTIIESDALDMHAVMATSRPAAVYLTEDSIRVFTWVRNRRQQGNFPAYITIDAGPNLHIICEKSASAAIAHELAAAFPQFELFVDQVGEGPTFVEVEANI